MTCRRSWHAANAGASKRQSFAGGDQCPHLAIAHDVGDLIGLEQRIEWHEDAAGSRCAEAGDDGLEALFEVDRDALAALQSETDEAADKTFD
jgi:hypothetical protein